MRTWTRACATLFTLGLVSTAASADIISDLLAKLPESANTIVAINVDALQRSQLGRKQNWDKRHELEYASGAIGMPPSATFGILAAQLNPHTMHTNWEIGVMKLDKEVDLAAMARKESSTVDMLFSQKAVLTARNAYFVDLGQRLLGTAHPANRQDAVRWVKFALKNTKPGISQYLQDAARGADRDAQIVMALDLSDLTDPKRMKRTLTNSKALAGKNVNVDAFMTLLGGVRGVRLDIRVKDSFTGELRVDFQGGVAPYSEVMQPLLLEVLDNLGMSIDSLEKWKVKFEPTAFVLEGSLTQGEARQILSLVLPPSAAFDSDTTAAVSGKDKSGLSLLYFQAINGQLDDLRAQQAKYKQVISNYGKPDSKNSKWFETAAKRIEQLPIVNVDPDLAAYGAATASKLRAIADSFRGVAIQASVLEQYRQGSITVSGGGYGYNGNYGGSVWVDNNYQQVRQQQAETIAKGQEARMELWRMIEDDTTKIRQGMVQRYKIEF